MTTAYGTSFQYPIYGCATLWNPEFLLLNIMFVHSPCEKPVRDSTELQDLYTYGILAVVMGI